MRLSSLVWIGVMGCAARVAPVMVNVSADHPLAAPQASDELRRAADLVDLGDVVGAEALLRTLLPVPTDPEEDAMAALDQALALYRVGDADAAGTLLRRVISELPRTRAATASRRMLDELSVVGRAAGELDVTRWLQGTTSFDQAPVTLLVFWEVWCPHCQREVPALQGLQDALQDQGLQVVGVTQMSRGVTDDDVGAFAEAGGVTYALGVEDGSLSARFGVEGVPAVAVISEGKVAWRGHPSLLGPEVLLRLLAEQPAP